MLSWRSMMRYAYVAAVASTGLLSCATCVAQSPPFTGTGFVDPDIIASSDASTLESIDYVGLEDRFVFDRRDNAFSIKQMHVFDAAFSDGLAIEVQVNPEFGDDSAAAIHATTYADSVGRLPTPLREDVETMWIHDGFQPFGGGNNNLLIHVPQAVDYGEFLEEILFHEATHTSFDADHAASAAWLDAQTADPTFISNYAQDNPTREDVAESLLMWFALRHRRERIEDSVAMEIETAIPNRLAYFDELPFDVRDSSPGGDYNEDGVVNTADYVVWRNNVGNPNALPNDDTVGVGPDDYSRWVANFGASADSPAGSGATTQVAAKVPEPSTLLSAFVLATFPLAMGSRRRAM